MNEPPDAEREPDGYIRLPWPLVAGGLLVLLAALFAFGLFANRNLRPQLTVAPTAVTVGETPTAGVVQVATPTALVAAMQVGTATSQLTAVAIATVAATATPAPTTASATNIAAATPEPAATPQPTVDPALAEDISLAYEHYWQIRAEALLNLDASRLHEVMDGRHLKTVEGVISELNSEGRVIETNVDHNYRVVEATASSATVVDVYVSNSVYLDIHTHTQVSEPSGDRITEIYDLTRLDGIWKVVNLAGS